MKINTSPIEWQNGHFQIHAIYTGAGESIFFIFPDGTSMLLDCGGHPAINRGELAVPVLPSGKFQHGEWVARYVERVNPAESDVDYLVVSHFHSDHTGCPEWNSGMRGDLPLSGFALASERLHFKIAVDRGWPNYDDPIPYAGAELIKSRDLMTGLYKALQVRDGLVVEKFRLGADNQFILRHNSSAYPDFKISNICANGKIVLKDGTVRDLYSEKIARENPDILNENGMSLGMIFRYGAFSFYTAGDFSDYWTNSDGSGCWTEDDLADSVGNVTVAKVNHHGYCSMREKLVAALSPKIWISCVWDQLHNLPETMERIHKAGRNDQVFIPGIYPAERRWEDMGATWQSLIPRECYRGNHIVVDVPSGGKTFSVRYISARNEEMNIAGGFDAYC